VICNIGLIVGVLCVSRPLDVRERDFRFPSLFMLAMGILLTALTVSLRLGRPPGLLLIACGMLYLAVDTVRHRRAAARSGAETETAEIKPAWGVRKSVVLFLLGAALWWSAALVTTVASEKNPVTGPGRAVAVMLMVYGMVVFGCFMGCAVVFIQGRQRETMRATTSEKVVARSECRRRPTPRSPLGQVRSLARDLLRRTFG